MRIDFTFSRSSDYIRNQLWMGARYRVRSLVVGSAALVLTGVVTVAASQGEGIGAFTGFALLVLSLFLTLRAWRSFRSALVVPESWRGPRHYLVTDEALESSTGRTSTRWGWEVVQRVTVSPEAYLFWQQGAKVFDLPREPLLPAQEADFREFLRSRGFSLGPR